MSDSQRIFATRLALALAGTVLVVMVFVVRVPAATADGSGCGDHNVCFWHLDNYNGEKVVRDSNYCGFNAGPCAISNDHIGWRWHSVKNRFGDRKVEIYDPDGFYVKCIGPGGERTSIDFPGGVGAYSYEIGALGTRC